MLTTAPGAPIDGKSGDGLTCGDQHALHVDGKGLLDGVVAEFGQRSQGADPGAVDEDVEALELFDDKVNRLGQCALFGDVRCDVANRIRGFGGELREGLLAATGDDHLCSFGDQSPGDGSTNTSASASDECDFIRET